MHVGLSCRLGNSLPDDISCLAADRMLVFAAAGKVISAFARNKEVGAQSKECLSLTFFYYTFFLEKSFHNLTLKEDIIKFCRNKDLLQMGLFNFLLKKCELQYKVSWYTVKRSQSQ